MFLVNVGYGKWGRSTRSGTANAPHARELVQDASLLVVVGRGSRVPVEPAVVQVVFSVYRQLCGGVNLGRCSSSVYFCSCGLFVAYRAVHFPLRYHGLCTLGR